MSLIDYIQQQTQIEKEPLEALDAIFQVREYKKYTLLLKEGSPSQEVFFIEEGIVRQFYTKEGKDITHASMQRIVSILLWTISIFINPIILVWRLWRYVGYV